MTGWLLFIVISELRFFLLFLFESLPFFFFRFLVMISLFFLLLTYQMP